MGSGENMSGFNVEAEKNKIKNFVEEVVEAENKGDVEASLAFYDKNVYALASGMKLMKGHNDLRGLYQEILKNMVSNENKIIDIKFSEGGDMCYLVASYHMVTRSPEGNVDEVGKYLAVLRKKAGRWKMEAMSYNAD